MRTSLSLVQRTKENINDYDYDKQLRQQNDDISKLRAQAAALQGVSNQASQARLARINDELAQKEKDMADSVAQHRYEVGSDGYSKLADSAQESLSDTLAMVASSSAQQEIIVQQMLANISAQYESAYDLIQQKIDETGTIISNTAEKQMQVNGEVNDYLDQMVDKSDQLKIAWDNYVNAVAPSGQTLEQALTGFITLIDSGTRHPKENWEAFVEAVGGTISTEAFQVFCDTISQGIATETEQWNAFKATIGGQIDDTVIRNLFDYINEHSGIAITDWQSFQQAVAQGKFDETQLTNLYSYVNEITGNSITDWQGFQQAIADGEFSQEQLEKIYVYASDQTKASITDWQGFQQAVADGKFSNEQLNSILNYASKTTGGLITNWETFESAVKGETPITGTVIDKALDTVQQKIDNIKKTWGEVINETTGESQEGVDKAQTAEDAKPAGQDVNTNEIPMNLTSSGKTVDQAAIDRENARKAAEEAARKATEETNRRKAAKADAKAKADAAYAKYLGYAPQIKKMQDEIDKNKRNWDNWVAKMEKAKHGSKEWKDAAAKAKHHRQAYETGDQQLKSLRAQQANWLAEYNKLQSYYKSLPSYKVGTKRTLEDELALTHDKEIILGNGAVLRQLPQGSQVLPKVQADNIWKWSKIDPLKDMGKGIGATASVNTINNTGNNFYYDSLIHIDGNVDADVMDRLEDFGKALINNRNFQKNLTNVVTKEFVREGRKLGYK